jgi:hypothetical protein
MANHPSPLIDLSDPEARAAWLAAARTQIEDLLHAAEDATAPLHARELGRRAARRIVGEAGGALRELLDAAGAAPTEEADRAGAGRGPSTGRLCP